MVMPDRPHADRIFQRTKPAFHLVQFLIVGYRVLRREIRLIRLDQILAFVLLLPRQVDRMLGVLELPGHQLPRVVTMTVVTRQNPLGGGADFGRVFQLTFRHARLQLHQTETHTLHDFDPLPLLVVPPFVTVDHKHTHAGTRTGHFLHTGPLLDEGFLTIDTTRTVQPTLLDHLVDQRLGFGILPPGHPQQEAPIPLRGLQHIQVFLSHHAPIANEHHLAKLKTLRQIADDLGDRRAIPPVARPHVMGDRPTGHHYHAHDHLDVAGLAITTVAVLGQAYRTTAREIRTRQIVENQI